MSAYVRNTYRETQDKQRETSTWGEYVVHVAGHRAP